MAAELEAKAGTEREAGQAVSQSIEQSIIRNDSYIDLSQRKCVQAGQG